MTKENKTNSVIYQGIDEWVNTRTGEVITANQIIKKTSRNGFSITYLSAIINLIEVLGNKKMQVVKYILSNMDKSTNTLLTTTRELSEKSNVSRKVVIDTLKILENAQIINRRTGAIMIHPNLIHKGNEGKHKFLLTRFEEFNDNDENEKDKKKDL